MITAIVQYKLPPHTDLAACAAHFRTIAPGFRDVPGLIRKQFTTQRTAGPVASTYGRRRSRQRPSMPGLWLDGIRHGYGMDPQIKLFETACITDNAIEAVLLPHSAG
jgi:hypothetical protein